MRTARASVFWRVIVGGFLLGLSLGLLRDHAIGTVTDPVPVEVPADGPAAPDADSTCLATSVSAPAPPCRDEGPPAFAV